MLRARLYARPADLGETYVALGNDVFSAQYNPAGLQGLEKVEVYFLHWTAVADVKNNRTIPVPRHLRDSHYSGAKQLDHGQGYKYPHDHPDAKVDQEYLGVDKTYYRPTDRGREALIKKFLQRHHEPNS